MGRLFFGFFILTFVLAAPFVLAQYLPKRPPAEVDNENIQDISKHRLSAYIGSFSPSGTYPAFGSYPETKFDRGFTGGAAYSFNIWENIEVGPFLDLIAFAPKEVTHSTYKTSVDITEIIFGLSASAAFPLLNGRLILQGGLSGGYAITSQTVKQKSFSASRELQDNGGTYAIGIIGEARYRITDVWDAGLILKYTYLNQKSDAEDIDLGGTSFLIAAGFRF
ncbi:MAG: porin family protein [Deferribacteraceae bacterium]|nr:porin family protein [Deferribacteraceae bacterium]